MRCPSLLGVGLLLLAVSSSAQQKGELRARELFYTPITEATPKAASSKPSESKPVAKVTKPVTKPSTSGTGPVQAGRRETSELPDGVKLQKASTAGDVVGPPLALKYRLLKLGDNGAYNEVDTDTVFRSGDKIRVSVESNDGAYLYIVQQGSSKTWNLLFPNEDTEQGSNRVERNREYEIPGGARFAFDEQPGTERLYLILSRRPEADLEKLIYSLSKGSNAAQPASSEGSGDRSKLMIASTRIDDAFMGQFRQRNTVVARDLVFEKVNDDKPVSTSAGTRKEKALYVATPDRTAQARIVVDISLKHQ